jgi:hypothetical protein
MNLVQPLINAEERESACGPQLQQVVVDGTGGSIWVFLAEACREGGEDA